ncbi:MAG TPA: Uma2 family endonuclease [Candidatus Xenobia bacterium]|jgi:Uma2 family endonuclease
MVLQRHVSFDEFMSWPEQKPYLEYFEGEVKPKAVPNSDHSIVQADLMFHLKSWDPKVPVVAEQRCLLKGAGSAAVLPDVAVFPPGGFTVNPKRQAVVPPRLAVEILSPDDTYADVQAKVSLYLEAGVPVVWVIDPAARNVTIHRAGERTKVVSEEGKLEEPLLPGFSLSLKTLFQNVDTMINPQPTEQP